MKVLVGLGNPGPAYMMNRHNVGFLAVDSVAQDFHFPPFKQKFNGLLSEGTIQTHKVLLFKPLTYMNLCGPAVLALLAFYKIPLPDLWVVSDDVDMEPGRLRVRKGGGSGGHNGLKSITSTIGPDYGHIKIGIGRPLHPGQDVAKFVLEDFRDDDEKWLGPLLDTFVKEIPLLAADDIDKFVSRVTISRQKEGSKNGI